MRRSRAEERRDLRVVERWHQPQCEAAVNGPTEGYSNAATGVEFHGVHRPAGRAADGHRTPVNAEGIVLDRLEIIGVGHQPAGRADGAC